MSGPAEAARTPPKASAIDVGQSAQAMSSRLSRAAGAEVGGSVMPVSSAIKRSSSSLKPPCAQRSVTQRSRALGASAELGSGSASDERDPTGRVRCMADHGDSASRCASSSGIPQLKPRRSKRSDRMRSALREGNRAGVREGVLRPDGAAWLGALAPRGEATVMEGHPSGRALGGRSGWEVGWRGQCVARSDAFFWRRLRGEPTGTAFALARPCTPPGSPNASR